jgi:hypothetical protein
MPEARLRADVPAIHASRHLGAFMKTIIVGWVERSDTHQCTAQGPTGIASLNPSYALYANHRPHPSAFNSPGKA